MSRGTAEFLLCPFIKAAEKSENVVSIRQGKGDHFIVRTGEGQSIPVPMHREIRTGTRWKLIKLFLKAGSSFSSWLISS